LIKLPDIPSFVYLLRKRQRASNVLNKEPNKQRSKPKIPQRVGGIKITNYMSNLLKLKSKAEFIASLNPAAYDAIHPHGPLFVNDHVIELFVADAVKTVSKNINNKNLQKQGIALSGKIAGKAAHGLIAGWEDGDDLCPPWPRPFPIGWFIPSYLAPVKVSDVEQVELVSTLIALSSFTMEKEFNQEIKNLASGIAGGISSKLADEVEKCGTVPRPHWGGGRGPRIKETLSKELVS